MFELSLWALLFFGALALAFGTIAELAVEKRAIFKSLRTVRTLELSPLEMRQRELSLPFARRVALPALRRLAGFTKRFTPASVANRLDKELVYAGSPAGWDAERFFAVKIAASAGFPILAFVGGRAAGLANARALILASFLGVLGYYIPEWTLRRASGKRQSQIRRALPDALDLLSITVEAGLAFDAAVARVARRAGGPMGEEFHRVLQEMQIGKARAEALRDLGERTTVDELKSFVLSMIQADVFGISIARVLQQQAHEMRVKRRQRAEERAQKLQVKIIMPLILCIFPSLFVVLLGPAALTIYDSLINR